MKEKEQREKPTLLFSQLVQANFEFPLLDRKLFGSKLDDLAAKKKSARYS